jgi:hypothetical protein
METKAQEKGDAEEEKGSGEKMEGKECGESKEGTSSIDMTAAWDSLGQTVMSDKFLGKMDPWMNENCDAFIRCEGGSNDDPNLHEQYEIHQNYTRFAEQWLEELLSEHFGQSFEMDSFLAKVPKYLEEDDDWEVVTTNAGDDGFGCRTKGGTKDLLNHMNNFTAFKVSRIQVRQLIQIYTINSCCLTLSALGS